MDFSKAKEIQIENPDNVKPLFDNNSTLPYLGKNYALKIIYNIKVKPEEKNELSNNIFFVYLVKKEIKTNERIKSLYYDWLVSQSNQTFKDKVRQYSRLLDLMPKRIVIKNFKK
jgi:predicted metal-dependent hydrolase